MYIRFQSPTPGQRGVHTGIFGLTNSLAKKGLLSQMEYADWRAGNDWYNAAYPDPSKTDPTVYDEHLHPLATAWFKDSATHLLERIPRYLEILAAHDVVCLRIEAEDPGRVIYEDEVQVVVVPHDPAATTSFHPAPAVEAASVARRVSSWGHGPLAMCEQLLGVEIAGMQSACGVQAMSD